MQISQKPIPQKEEILLSNTPLEQAGSGVRGTIPFEKNVEGTTNTSATSAHLQAETEPEKAPQRWDHFRLLDVVLTPKGEGMVIQDWPTSVGVRLYETGETIYFTHPADIRKIRVKTDVLQPSSHESLYSPNVWPYNDPEWTDERIAQMGEPTRAQLGFPFPSSDQSEQEDR